MKISNISLSNNITAPLLLIAAMLILILFRSVFFAGGDILYAEPEQSELSENEIENSGENESRDFITVNNVKYKPDRFFILAVITNICAFLLPAVFYVRLKGAGNTKNLKLNMPGLKYLFLCVNLFFVLIAGTVLINSLVFFAEGANAVGESVVPLLVNTGRNPVYDIGILISLVILPAVCEEFFFRSALAAEYEKYGAVCAIVMTSLAFASAHFSLKFFPAYLFAAMILYIAAKITNSVLFAVSIHAGYNLFGIYLWDKLSGVLNFEQNRFTFIFIISIIFIVFVILVLNRLEDMYYKKAYYNEPSPAWLTKKKGARTFINRFFRSFLSPSFIAAVIIFFIYINVA